MTVKTNNCTTQVVVPGANVTIKQGTTVIATGVTDSTGVALIPISNSGNYTVQVTASCGTASNTVSAACNVDTAVTLLVPGAALSIHFTSAECGSTVNSGTARLTGPGGFDSLQNVTTSGAVGFCVGSFGTYTLTYTDTAGCWQNKTSSVTVNTCSQITGVTLDAKTWNFRVFIFGCNNLPLPGVTVSYSGAAGSGSAVSGSDGWATLTGLKARCTFSATFSKTRWVTATKAYTQGCGNSNAPLNVVLDIASGFQCMCEPCFDPVLDPFVVQDSQGTHTIISSGGVNGTMTTNCIQRSNVDVRCGDCLIEYKGSVGYFYHLSCNSGTLILTRVMPACPVSASNPDFTHPVESSCFNGAPLCPVSPPECGPGPGGGLSNKRAGEVVTMAMSSAGCNPISVTFSFVFGWSDSALVTG